MTIKVRIAILSHLSDAQFLISSYKNEEAARHIDFAKLLAIKYHDTDVYVESERLDELWGALDNRYK